MTLLQSGLAKSLAEDYTIDQSLRFEDGDSAYLSRTVGTATSHQIGTFSVWIKKTQIGNTEGIFFSYDDGDNRTGFYFEEWDTLDMYGKIGGSAHMELTSLPKSRDPGAWMHAVYSVDVTQTTAADRVKLYVNGEQVSAFNATIYPAQNTDIPLFDATNMVVGARVDNPGTPGLYFDGYLAEFYYIDGQALDASSFGETDSTSGQWKPIEYDGTYGNNGFYQKYAGTELADSFEDSSSSDHTITANGDVANTRAQSKIGDSSIVFDGTGDYLSVPSSSDWDFGTDDFTWEFWWRFDDVTTTDQGFISVGTGVVDSASVYYQTSGRGVGMVVDNTDLLTGTGEIFSNDTWYHIAFVKDSGTSRLYIDGVQKDSVSDSQSYSYNEGLVVGRMYPDVNNYYAEGCMDEVRISDTCRYPDGTTFTTFGQDGGTIASPTPFTADSNTLLLIHSDWDGGLGADSSGNENTFTVNNLVATDQVEDSPTNNFCTLNAVNKSSMTLSEGNLKGLGTT
jgi:hypothetical protein|tara:strand:+ start:321 stop:1844 length:1524 start_codon:yes stop_codon:yes gene_type:complete